MSSQVDSTSNWVSLFYIAAFASASVFWSYSLSDSFHWPFAIALILKVAKDSLEEGNRYWPRSDMFDTFVSMRMYAHIAICLAIVACAILFQISEYRNEWNSGTVPTVWRIFLYVLVSVYGASSLPSLLAISKDGLWADYLKEKQRLSILVIREIVTVAFSIPLIYNLSDIIDNGDDSEWRHLAASLVFTRAVIYFIVFWYIENWSIENPLQNDRILSEICRGSGMLIIYIVVIRRLHENKLLTEMGFVDVRDDVALIAAFLSLACGYIILFNNSPQGGIAPTGAILSALLVIVVLMLIIVGSV